MLDKFYADVLPQSGHFCLFTLHDKAHIWANSHEQLIARTETRLDMPGVYFATASYQTSDNREQVNVKAVRSLRADIDAGAEKYDRNPRQNYRTQKLALAALVNFVKVTGLMPTYIVSSGNGLHVYWCMDADINPAEWKPMAVALENLGKRNGLMMDPACTKDSARILRPLGTVHHDDVRVKVLQRPGVIWSPADLRAKIGAPEEAVVPVMPRGMYDTSINQEALTVVRRAPVSAHDVADKCAALRRFRDIGGNVQEPYWRAMLGLVKHTIEGEPLAHEWSKKGYGDYDYDVVQKKMDGWNAGPTRCTEFENHVPDVCKACMHYGQQASPITLANPVVQAEPEPVAATAAPAAPTPTPTRPAPIVSGKPWVGYLPPGYDVDTSPDGKTHTLYTMEPKLDEEGKPKFDEDGRAEVKRLEITNNIWWAGQWAGAEHADDKARFTISLFEHGHVKVFPLEQNILASLPDFKKSMADLSIHPLTGLKASKAMLDYGIVALRNIHHQGRRLQISDHLGLRVLPDGHLAATQGEYTIFHDGHIEHSMLAGDLRDVARQFRVPLTAEKPDGKWGPEIWNHIEPLAHQHVRFLKTHYGKEGMERLQVAIMMGLASPFMPFVEGKFQSGSALPRVGLSVSLYSRASGAGKTTAVAAAIAAYGSPQELTNDGGKGGSTEKARGARLSYHGTLPNIMDEMGSNTPLAIAQAVSMVANGAAREKAGRERGLVISSSWALVNLMTTNTSQRDMIAAVQESSDAIQQRLLEINMDDLPAFDTSTRVQFNTEWAAVQNHCIGALGAVIHREIVKQDVAVINQFVSDCSEMAAKKLGGPQGNRFQYRGLGAMIALFITLQRVGIEIFPMPALFAAFKQAHDAGQEFIAENVMPTGGLQILSRALHELKPNFLITEKETKRSRHNADQYDMPVNGYYPDDVQGRHIIESRRTYVRQTALRAWCSEHGLSESEIMKDVRKADVLVLWGTNEKPAEKFDLYKGMKTTTQDQVLCYRIDTAKLARALGQDVDDIVPAEPPAPTNVVTLTSRQ